MLKDLRGDGGGEEAMAECLVAYGKYHFDRGERERAERDFAQAMEVRDAGYGIQNFSDCSALVGAHFEKLD